jgi:hypothetical protein
MAQYGDKYENRTWGSGSSNQYGGSGTYQSGYRGDNRTSGSYGPTDDDYDRSYPSGSRYGSDSDYRTGQYRTGTQDYGSSSDRDYSSKSSSYGASSGSGIAIEETHRLIGSDKVQGTAVYDRDGARIGTIHNFMVDKRSGKAEYAVMSFGGFLGMGQTYYPLPWQMLDYDTDLGGFRVEMDEEDLDHAPSFRAGGEPEFDDQYGRQVHSYYGLGF